MSIWNQVQWCNLRKRLSGWDHLGRAFRMYPRAMPIGEWLDNYSTTDLEWDILFAGPVRLHSAAHVLRWLRAHPARLMGRFFLV